MQGARLYATEPVRGVYLAQLAALGTLAERFPIRGLLPQLPGLLPVFIGLGYRAFSVNPAMLPWLAEAVRRTDTERATALARSVCEACRPEDVGRLLGLWRQGG